VETCSFVCYLVSVSGRLECHAKWLGDSSTVLQAIRELRPAFPALVLFG
jgi:hypothetical protein